MKKLFAILFTVIFAFSALAACTKSDVEGGNADSATLNVYAPDGAPALAISKYISDKEDFGTGAAMNYNVIAADNIQTVITSGKADIMIMPVNLATKIYALDPNAPYKMAGVITHGNLYLLANKDVTLEDLKGKVVGVANLSNVPGLTFKAILKAAGIEFDESDSPVEGKIALCGYTGAELKTAMANGSVSYGVLPEPVATALSSSGAFKIALDLQQLYDGEAKAYPQAVVMIKASVLAKYPSLADDFGAKIASSVSWIKENTQTAAQAIASVLQEGVTQSINAKNLNPNVVDNCKIYWQSAAQAKASINAYITSIRGVNAKAANEVSDDFFA